MSLVFTGFILGSGSDPLRFRERRKRGDSPGRSEYHLCLWCTVGPSPSLLVNGKKPERRLVIVPVAPRSVTWSLKVKGESQLGVTVGRSVAPPDTSGVVHCRSPTLSVTPEIETGPEEVGTQDETTVNPLTSFPRGRKIRGSYSRRVVRPLLVRKTNLTWSLGGSRMSGSSVRLDRRVTRGNGQTTY